MIRKISTKGTEARFQKVDRGRFALAETQVAASTTESKPKAKNKKTKKANVEVATEAAAS
jgi:hypothetical protein